MSPLSAVTQESGYRALFTYPHSKQNKISIDAKMLGVCLATTATSFSTETYFDRTFKDSSQTFNDFIDYLGASASRKYDFMTGNESLLRQWVFKQAENSIDFLNIFEESLRINDGNIFDSVLTIHQLLRNEARFFDAKRYRYRSNAELHRRFFSRFIDIRGDLVERGPGYNGDHAGSWYRFWGTMLYEMMWYPETLEATNNTLSGKQKANAFLGKQLGKSLSAYVEYSKYISPKEFDVSGKINIGIAGTETAHSLLKSLWKEVNPSIISACADKKYLKEEIFCHQQNTLPLVSRMLPKVDLTEQMGPTLHQQNGTCYAYAFAGAVDAALYRFDQKHRNISPDFLYTRIFANNPADSSRLLKTLIGSEYADGHIGSRGSDMFELLAKFSLHSNYYVEDTAFRPILLAAQDNASHDSWFDTIKAVSSTKSAETLEVFKSYKSMYQLGLKHLINEPLLRELKLTKEWTRKQDNQVSLLPVLARLLRSKIPPIVVFYYDLSKSQVNRHGGNSWVPLPKGLFSMPVWHAAVLQKVDVDSQGETYLIFRDSFANGTPEIPNMSQIRIRLSDAQSLITQVYSISANWDQY